jgi:transcriptional regulator with XRE-family HTH domain
MTTSFFERLRFVIALKKMSQKHLSEQLGVDKGTISRWRKKPPSIGNVMKICEVIGCNYEWLADGTGEPFPGVVQRAKIGAAELARQGVQIWPSLAEQDAGYNVQPSREDQDRKESINEEEAVEQTLYVLRSNTVYRGALLSNIRAFFRGVKKEEEMEGIGELLLKMQEKHESDMRELKELIKAKNEIDPQKRDKIANS